MSFLGHGIVFSMNQEIEISSSNESDNLSVAKHVDQALEQLLSQFKDKKKGIRILAKKMGIHEKTLNRLINQENAPSYQTVFKIFRVFFNEFNDAKLLDLVPKEIKDFLIKANPQEVVASKSYTSNADTELQKNPIVAEIFILVATGPLTMEDIEYRFGRYGVELTAKMIEKNLIVEAHKGVYVLGNNQPEFNGDTILSVGKVLTEAYAKVHKAEELNNNFISFFAEGLSEEAYGKWLEIDQEAFRKKFELSKDPKNLGAKRAFTFMISETMELKDIQ